LRDALEKPVQQPDLGADDREKNPCPALRQVRPDLPQACLELANERHAKRPANLDGLDVLANGFLLSLGEAAQPFPYRFASSVRPVKANG